jgi:chromosome transmission fidelity protein 1
MALQLPTPDTFPAFPYNPPYPIQVELMRHLYQSIEQKKVSIVESPTGTVRISLFTRTQAIHDVLTG